MSILPVGIGPQEGGYQIERSLRFNSADSAYLSRTLSSSNRQTFTFNVWVKKTVVGSSTGAVLFCSTDNSTSTGWLHFNSGSYGSADTLTFEDQSSGTVLVTSQLFRDPSAWYMITLSVDTTQATASNRVKLYVNGTRITAFSTETYPATQGANTNFNRPSSFIHTIGSQYTNNRFFNGYISELNFIDGQALDPTSFGEYNSDTGVWQPKAYTGSYGTNGFYLDFADNSSTTALGYDAAGSNDWTPNNFSVTAGAGNDSLVDTPTPYGTDTGVGAEVRGNYCTLNPLNVTNAPTLSNGNLDFAGSTSNASATAGTIGISSGKWYWEVLVTNTSALGIGIFNATVAPSLSTIYDYENDGRKRTGGVASSYGASFTTNDIIGVALDLDGGTLVFYKNNTSQGTAFSGLAGTLFVAGILDVDNVPSATCSINFGQRPFAYTAPSGFKALCTQNLPEPTIADGGEYFNAVTYTGTGSAQSITGVGFQPDLVWLKARSNAYTHVLVDSIRGTDKVLVSASTGAENTTNSGEDFTAFNSDGFSVGTPVNFNSTNANGATIVGWNWKANGAGVSNTAGSITSTVSANTTAGFSIVTYTGNGTSGATVGHGLGAAPSMVIVKEREFANAWCVYHSSVGATKFLYLNQTDAATTQSDIWNDTAPTSTVFSVGNANATNRSTKGLVAYCFAPVEGYSAFGSYTGNGSADGPFVYTGFRPRFIMVKRTDFASTWVMIDTARDPYNDFAHFLYPNTSAAEDVDAASDYTDSVSNGFKVRNTWTGFNGSGGTYIYAAFAENPFKYSLAR